ncbi:MAG: hypothetical protein ABSG67_20260 [Thermoguttaceae bacterium]|jgi:hypothetical protein
MTDFHHNIFYYYSGPNYSKQKQYDQQLENNTTKALVNTLKYCDKFVANSFLAWLGIHTTSNMAVEFQKATIGRERIRLAREQRLLLAITQKPRPDGGNSYSRLKLSDTQESRPDAWLFGEDFVVLMESKIGDGALNSCQMKHHYNTLLAGTREKPRCLVRTWSNVHGFFNSILPRLNEKDKWLVGQFTQYLEYQCMSDFTGFEEWMFDFFIQEEKDEKEKNLIRHSMEGFSEKVLEGGLKALDPDFYEQAWLGNISRKGNSVWVAFVPLVKPKVFTRKVHQTISLSDRGLKVFVNFESQHTIKLLRKRMRNNDDKKRLIDLLARSPSPFLVRIDRKVQRQNQPRIFDGYPLAELVGGEYMSGKPGLYGLKNPESRAFASFENLLFEKNKDGRFELAYIAISKQIDRKEVLRLSKGTGERLVKEVFGIMKKFHPIVQFINDAEN